MVKSLAYFFTKLLLPILSLWSMEGVYYVKLANSDVCTFEGGGIEMPIIAKKKVLTYLTEGPQIVGPQS